MINSITLKCERQVAENSPDHVHPLGTRQDNSSNKRFNMKLNGLYGKPISVLDLGCSGGGFVKDCLDDGNLAVGLEGSDYSKKMGRAEWRTIPQYLFTCDITKNFELYDSGKPLKFDVITLWEVLEHIHQDDLPLLICNIKKHLSDDGLVVISISNNSSVMDGVELHQTRKPKEWWTNFFKNKGLVYRPEFLDYFNTQYIRGKYEAKNNFHLVLSKPSSRPPTPPKLRLSTKLYDRYKDSTFQILLKILVTAP